MAPPHCEAFFGFKERSSRSLTVGILAKVITVACPKKISTLYYPTISSLETGLWIKPCCSNKSNKSRQAQQHQYTHLVTIPQWPKVTIGTGC